MARGCIDDHEQLADVPVDWHIDECLKVLAVRSLSVRASDFHGREATNVKMTNTNPSVRFSHESDFLSHAVVKVAVAC
jgi:hypothetical protein